MKVNFKQSCNVEMSKKTA